MAALVGWYGFDLRNVPVLSQHALAQPNPISLEGWATMYSSGITLPQARQVIRDVMQIFGPERTIYGSNFPLEKLHASYAEFFGIYRTILAEYTEAEQRAVLHDNAAKFYRI